ncbi:phosphatase PAP2 family protein [Streptomyces sp. CA-210063]|uniref:phosphatase PAP2 family protein n=1 Tax=Streptomyces sp. CA-210063 TaxID=2801029 RepID=UPI00214AF031|nr:phosphatase PAP2 family protein [Streptomyces sp. CA-210063]UUU29957.1 phosphatase PAP2 family protein [Streptomyces sp. CA-210063]
MAYVRVVSALRERDRRLARRLIAWGPPWLRRVGAALEGAAEHTRLWWAAAATLAVAGGWRGRRAAAAGVAAMAAAEVLSNGVAKPVCERRRPPREWVPPENLRDRPASSSFPSGHTAAAVAFSGAVALVWPAVGAVCGAAGVLVGAQRLHSGAHYPADVAVGGALGLVPRQPRFARQGAASGACSRRAGRKSSSMDRTCLGFRPVRRGCVPGAVGAVRGFQNTPWPGWPWCGPRRGSFGEECCFVAYGYSGG